MSPATAPLYLFKLQIGPVQDFISQARSTRDLWSGSYLLSWLMAAGIEKIGRSLAGEKGGDQAASQAAQDALIYPSLRGQPLVEWRFDRKSLLSRHFDILTPNLPNILVARFELDENKATHLAKAVEEAIRKEWAYIAGACWAKCETAELVKATRHPAFQSQVSRFLSVAWQVTPEDKKEALSNMHPIHYDLCSWQLDAVRQCRAFQGWREGRWHRQDQEEATEKDTLTGREESLLGGKDWHNSAQSKTRHPLWSILLREKHKGDYLGAITLVKRTWHWHYLSAIHHFKSLHVKEASPRETEFPFPSTRHVALHMPASNADLEGKDEIKTDERLDAYLAVLAFDGDEIGKWISGEKRSVDLEFHRDFSRKLSHFALKCARPIVEACDGRLIYAGGDDVLALVPADTALLCAECLRAAYRGDFQALTVLLQPAAAHLLKSHLDRKLSPQAAGHQEEISHNLIAASTGQLWENWRKEELPGHLKGDYDSRPEASVGIAIAHFTNPLQDMVRSAQAAEKRAKREHEKGGLGRAAVSVYLVKRSGEHVEWGCKWSEKKQSGPDQWREAGGLELFRQLAAGIAAGGLSARFPYRLLQLLSVYQRPASNDFKGFQAADTIKAEFAHVLKQQSKPSLTKAARDSITTALGDYLECLEKIGGKQDSSGQFLLQSIVGMCQTLAFTLKGQRAPVKPSASPADFVFA